MADVNVDLKTNAEKLIENLREIQRGLGGVNTEVKKVDKSVDELNQELLEQKDVVKEIENEEKRLTALRKKNYDKAAKEINRLSELEKKGSTQAASFLKRNSERRKKAWDETSKRIKRVRADLITARNEQRKLTEETKRTVAQQKKAAKEANRGSRIFKKLGGAIAGAFAVTAIIRFGKESVKLFNDQAQAEQKLLVALKGRQDIQQDLIASAKVLQGRTIFADEEIIAAQSLVAAFTKEKDQIKELTRVTLDFATAKGFDLKAAAELVSKTFASSTNSLTRYGVQVEGTAGSSERLTSVITNLDAAFKGQAEAAAETGAGSLIQFQNQVNDLKEVLGGALLPVLTVITGSLKKLFDRTDLDNYTDGVDDLTTKFEDLITVSEVVGENIQIGFEGSDPALLKQIADLQKQLAEDAAAAAEELVVETKTINDLREELKELVKEQGELNVLDKRAAINQAQKIKDKQDEIKALTQLNKEKEEQIKLDKEIAVIDDKTLTTNEEILEVYREQIRLIQERKAAKNEELLVDKTNIDELTSSIEAFGGNLEALGVYPDLISEIGAAFAENISVINSFGSAAQKTLSGLALLNKENAEYQRSLAIAQILVDEILAVANAVSSVKAGDPITYAVLAASIAGAVISAFAGIKAQANATSIPNPKFAEGTPFVQGEGTSTSDSIPAWLSVGERVVPADDNKTNWQPLEAIRKGEFDKHYFDKESVINLAKNYEVAKEKGFADNIAAGLGMIPIGDNHEDLFNIRGKLGNSNYWLKSIDSKLGKKGKYEKR